MKFHDFSPFYRSNEGIKPKVSGDRLLDNPLVADVQSGASFKFDGSDDIVTVADSDNLDFGSGDLSYELWVKPSEQKGADQWLIAKYQSSPNKGYYLRIPANTSVLKATLSADSGGSADGSTDIIDGNWHHVVVSYDRSANISLYVDGVFDGSVSCPSGDTNGSGSLYFGRYPLSSDEYFDGEIRQARLHNRALSADEVRAAYSGQAVPYEYVGASQTELITGGDFTSVGTWSTNGGASIGSGVLTINGSGGVSNYAYQVVAGTVGKKYLLSYDVTANDLSGSGTVRLTGGTNNVVNSDLALTGTTVGTGHTQIFDGAETGAFNQIVIGVSAGWTGGSISIDNLSITQIGCVAEYLPTGINSTRWMDTSGNGLHGTTSTATAVNHKIGSLTLATLSTDSVRFDGAAGTRTGSTLDHYEEGTWTPRIYQAGANEVTSPTNATGRYIRIGGTLWLSMYFLKTSGATSAAGQWEVQGLPYQVTTGLYQFLPVGYLALNGADAGASDSASGASRWQANSTTKLLLYGAYASTSWTSGNIEFAFNGTLRVNV